MPTWKFGFGPPSMIEPGAPGFSKLMSRIYWPIRLKLGALAVVFAAVSSAMGVRSFLPIGRRATSRFAGWSQADHVRLARATVTTWHERSIIRELVSGYGI